MNSDHERANNNTSGPKDSRGNVTIQDNKVTNNNTFQDDSAQIFTVQENTITINEQRHTLTNTTKRKVHKKKRRKNKTKRDKPYQKPNAMSQSNLGLPVKRIKTS